MTLPTPAPGVNPETRAFWEATAEGRLLLQRCDACATVLWYPKGLCTSCGGSGLSWFPAEGRGVVYSFTVHRRGREHPDYHDAGAYVIAYVELPEGPRILTNIVDCEPDDVEVGLPVEVVFHDTRQGTALYRFRPSR